MLTYDALARHPRGFRSLTGFDPAGFDPLFDDYHAAADRRRRRTRTTKKGIRRQRAVGAGPKPTLDARKAYASMRAEYPDRPLITPEPAGRNHPLDEHQRMANRFIARYRIVVEHTLAQMNSYTVPRQVWRGRRESHHRVVRVVGGLVNRRIDAVPLKRYPKAA